MKRAIILILATALTITLFFYAYNILEERYNIVYLAEPRLEALVKAILEIEDEPITKAMAKTITHIDASGLGISNLSGMESFANLTHLNLHDNFIKDVTPLRGLLNLEELNLRNNEIISLEAINLISLSKLPNLKVLSLRHNVLRPDPGNRGYQYRIADISVLRLFVNLEVLELRDNHIVDISPIAHLRKLKTLDISQNPISNGDIGALANLILLESLNLRECDVKDISVLANMTGLEYLNLHSNENLIDIEPLARLTSLETLIMRNVPLGYGIIHLQNLTALTEINLRNTGIKDLRPLATLMKEGALQDDPSRFIEARVDISDNPLIDEYKDLYGGYAVLKDYWHNITHSSPKILSFNKAPTVSLVGGFYDGSLKLEMNAPKGSIIYYTLDGSNPLVYSGEGNTFIYRGPISIDPYSFEPILSNIPTVTPEGFEVLEYRIRPNPLNKAIVVRAIAYDHPRTSEVTTQTFFVGEHNHELPILSIVADPMDLFDYNRGIYVPGEMYANSIGYEGHWMTRPANYLDKTEIPAHIQLYDRDELLLDQSIGLRIHGGWTRAFPLKGLRLYARKAYDEQNYFDIDPFSKDISSNKRFILRSAPVDALWQNHIRSSLKVDLLASIPIVHYINGEYWGIMNMSERFDKHYLIGAYGIREENIVIIEGPNWEIIEGNNNDLVNLLKLHDYLEHNDLSFDEHYRYVEQRLNIESFIDYNIARIYSADRDGVNKHFTLWMDRDLGVWNVHTWDFDNALVYFADDTMAFYANDDERSDIPPYYTFMMTSLLRNDGFRTRFINRFADLINATFSEEHLSKSILQDFDLYSSEIQNHIARWDYNANAFGRYDELIEEMLVFARLRPDFQRQHIIDYFSKRGFDMSLYTLKINSRFALGEVMLNSIIISRDTPGLLGEIFEGVYFTGNEITLEAIPKPGFEFIGWETNYLGPIDFGSPIIKVNPSYDVYFTPVFRVTL